jgi:kexin
MRLFTLLAAYGSLALAFSKPAKRDWDAFDYYVVEHHPASGLSVDDAVVALGAQVVGPAGELPDHWIVRSSKTAVLDHKRALGSISYLEKQSLRQRVKRDGPMLDPTIPTTRKKRNSSDIASALGISDPEFHNQWHLVNDVAPANSMNVSGLWSMGITGKGVISAMVDDGLDYTSDDLATNFVRTTHALCAYQCLRPFFRMLLGRMTSTTIPTFLPPLTLMTITELVVLARSLLARTTHVVLASHMTLR